MQEIVLKKSSDLATVKSYFEGVLALSRRQEEFPVSLDEVWPLAYGRKEEAVRSLKANFIQNVDYQVFRIFAENLKGGRPTENYRLSVSCLEYFIARKVRAVFEVYRRVFHKAAQQPSLNMAALPQDYLSALKALVAAEEAKRLAQQRLSVAQPKADYCDTVLSSRDAMTTTQVAKTYGMSAAAFNRLLKDKGVQYKSNGQWVLCQRYAGKGYVSTRTFPFERGDGRVGASVSTVWTQKGRKFLYDFLKGFGLEPKDGADQVAQLALDFGDVAPIDAADQIHNPKS